MKIHPTAIIHREAELSQDVEIGAYVCVEGPAKIGPGCVLQSHAVLIGNVSLRQNNLVGHGSVLGGAPQICAFIPSTRSEVIIGDGNTFREHCTVHRGAGEGSATVVGNSNYIMAGAHLGHNVKIGSNIILANNVLLGGYVQVGDRAFLGGGSVYHQHIRVGKLVITQGNSGFSKEVPPYTLGAEINWIIGLNVVGARRAGLTADERQEVKDAFNLLYKSGLNTGQALDRSRDRHWGPHGREFFDFVAASGKRGIANLMESRHKERSAQASESGKVA